jgi:hypothetical protein
MLALVILTVVLLLVACVIVYRRKKPDVGRIVRWAATPAFYFSVGAIFKNESHILKEWLEHYAARGVEHFYLINDDSTDNFRDILDPWIEKGTVTLFDTSSSPSSKKGRQVVFYEKFFAPILRHTRWLAILDLDEFLYSPTATQLPTILKRYEHLSQIRVNWVWFGSNGFVKQPASVVQGFTKRATYGHRKWSPGPNGWGINGSHGPKCIFQTSMYRSFGIHEHRVKGRTENLSYERNVKDPLLLINHYAVQSLDFWMTVKATRGDANRHFRTDARNLDYFKCWDINDIEDLRLANQVKNGL